MNEDIAAELGHDLLAGHEAPAVPLVPVLDVGGVDLLRSSTGLVANNNPVIDLYRYIQ